MRARRSHLSVAERRVVDEDPRGSRLLEDLRLTRLRDRQPAGAELELPETDLGRLVRLRVRPERDPVRVGVRLQVAQVGLEPIEVDHRDRRLDLAQRPPDLRLEQLERPVRSCAHSGGCSHLASEHRGHPEAVDLDRVAWRNLLITTSRRNSAQLGKWP